MANENSGGPQAQAAALFGTGIRYVPGLGYVGPQVPGPMGSPGPLGDDASVMMISGLASEGRQVAVDPASGAVAKVTGAAFTLRAALTQPVRIGSLELPLWAWLLIGAGVLSVAGYYMLFNKKK